MKAQGRKQRPAAIDELLWIMARLRAPRGCPWDRQQNHRSLRWHAVEEVYELLDAIEAGDDHELEEELGGGWEVIVGPREAAHIPRFLRDMAGAA